MNREELKELGLTEEQIETVMASHGKAIGQHKKEVEDLKASNTELTGQLKERDTQLTDLKTAAGDNKELQDTIASLEEKNQTIAAEYESKVKEITLNNAIKLALNGKVHDEDITSGLIKQDELVISEDGKIVGLDEQVNNLKESKPFLFKEETPGDQGGTGNNGFKQVGHDHKSGQGTEGADAVSAAFGNIIK